MPKSKNVITLIFNSLQIDFIAVGIIYLMPEIVSATGLPIYLLEPMRVMTLIALVHTGKENAIILAAGLPLVGYIIGQHPSEIKSTIMAVELLTNVFTFYALNSRMSVILSMPLAIVIAKGIYYGLKWFAITFHLLDPPLIATPWAYQIGVLVFTTLYAWFYMKK